ncbi:RHS repeat domain-containing protein [Pedobacter sp. MW01-1-1]|uniref:RHS repeat domain-containing protein n=1 Tax=Pedobacter sp. MW01-1-1 TaxID=3383027 RepID=UPI003FEFD0C8
MGSSNYTYDAIGNLTGDAAEGISDIQWSVYGKIKQINKNSGNIVYNYDASGNRISKTANGLTTWYVRDAQGNALALYDNAGGTNNWREQTLYGSSRLGIWKPNINLASQNGGSVWNQTGKIAYELSNHLGNTMATISDNRLQVSGGYKADVLTAGDYYAFGMAMSERSFTASGASTYRYGFNGKENDGEVNGQQDYGMRIYDSRLGRFKSVDPITKQYPSLTPYQFASNVPTSGVDRDGLELEPSTVGHSEMHNREWAEQLRKRDPKHADGIIKQANVNAFLIVGSMLTAGNGALFSAFANGVVDYGAYKFVKGTLKRNDADIAEGVHLMVWGATGEIGGALLGKTFEVTSPLLKAWGSSIAKAFEGGGTKLISSEMLNKYPNSPVIGNPLETFIAPTSEVNKLIESGASRAKIAETLGIEDPLFFKGELIRVDIKPSVLKELNLRVPLGNEVGANSLFVPGGKTVGGTTEAIVNGIPKNSSGVKISEVKIKN